MSDHLNFEKSSKINADLILRYADTKNLVQVSQIKLTDLGIEVMESLDLIPKVNAINLAHNRITKIEGLNKLQELRELSLNHNRLEEVYNSAFENNKTLTSLSLAYNKIVKIHGLQSLQRLMVLNLQGNCLTTLEFLSPLKELRALNLDFNMITKIDSINYLSKIEELSLADNKITEISDRELNSHTNLFDLNISGNKLKSISFIKNLTGLTVLDASRNNIDSIINTSKVLENLERLYLSNNNISTVEGIDKIFPNLVCLDLSSNQLLRQHEFKFIKGIPDICELSFKDNPIYTTEFVQQIKDMEPLMEVLNDEVLHKPGYKEKFQIKELETKLNKDPNNKGLVNDSKSEKDGEDEKEWEDDEEGEEGGEEKDLEADTSFKGNDAEMRESQSFFKTDTPVKKGGKGQKQVTTEKKSKDPKNNKYEEMIDTEEKFKDFVDHMSLQMYQIKAKADEILKWRKMRDHLGSPMKDSKISKSPAKPKEDKLIEEVDSLLESSTVIKNSDSSTKLSENSKDTRSEPDVDQLRILEEKYRGQFIGSREGANAVKRNILIRKSNMTDRNAHRKTIEATRKAPESDKKASSPESLRESIFTKGSETTTTSMRNTAKSVDKKKNSMSATGFYPSSTMTYTEVKEKHDTAYREIKNTLMNTNLRDSTNRNKVSKRIEEAIKGARPPKDLK